MFSKFEVDVFKIDGTVEFNQQNNTFLRPLLGFSMICHRYLNACPGVPKMLCHLFRVISVIMTRYFLEFLYPAILTFWSSNNLDLASGHNPLRMIGTKMLKTASIPIHWLCMS